MSPTTTMELLDELEALGFTDAAFAKLHHFRLKGRNARIQAHRHYCAKTEAFLDDGENERVQRRLNIVLQAYRQGGFQSSEPQIFVTLADAAFHQLPPRSACPY